MRRRAVSIAALVASGALALAAPAALGWSQPPTNTEPPSIAGTFKPGQLLTASPGQWSDGPGEFEYQWEICDSDGDGCTIVRFFSSEPTYVLQPANALGYVRVQVTAGNSFGQSDPVASALQKVSPASELVVGPPKIEAAQWTGRPCCGNSPPRLTKTLSFDVLTGYCLGESPPELDRVSVVERRATARHPFRSAVITVFIKVPGPLERVGTPNPGEPIEACAGLGSGVSGHIKLKRPVEHLFLFDGRSRPYTLVRRPRHHAHRATG